MAPHSSSHPREKISMMRTNLLHRITRSFIRFPRSIVRRNLTFPLLRTPRIINPILSILLVSLSGWTDRSSTTTDFPRSWNSYHVFPKLDEVENDTNIGILAVNFIIGLGFAVTRSSHDSCWIRFAIATEQIARLKWLMSKKLNKWFHSSRLKFPSIKIYTSWFLVFMYLIWILESKLIQSNNQSRATLFLETCLIVGLLPLMIILSTASLTSNTYDKASWSENWTFERTQSMLFSTLVFPWDLGLMSMLKSLSVLTVVSVVFPETETITSHKSRSRCPSNLYPASKEMISNSVELWETRVCFLHIQLVGTNVWLPNMHNVLPEVDFESSRSPAKSESRNSPSLHCLAIFPTWQYCLYSLVWWIYEISQFRRLSQALVHFCYGSCKLIHWP